MAAGAYALVAWLVSRSTKPERRFKMRLAALESPIFIFYMLAGATTLLFFGPPRWQHRFTKGDEPLPNGYALTSPMERSDGWLSAPKRIVGFSRIKRIGAPDQPTVSGYVRSLEVDGPFMIGAYDWRYESSPANNQANQGYFKLNTDSGTFADLATDTELARLDIACI